MTIDSGKTVFLYFCLFFITVGAINACFIYTALRTNTGVITEDAYEKGLSYNEIISSAKTQPELIEKMEIEDGIFRWNINDSHGLPVKNAKAKVIFVRPVKDGNDFEVTLTEMKPGIYEAQPNFLAKGLWTAQLDLIWNNKQYRTAQNIIVK